MRYVEFNAAIQKHLEQCPRRATWAELKKTLALPYEHPCPEWTRRLEHEIGLVRREGSSRALTWELQAPNPPPRLTS